MSELQLTANLNRHKHCAACHHSKWSM